MKDPPRCQKPQSQVLRNIGCLDYVNSILDWCLKVEEMLREVKVDAKVMVHPFVKKASQSKINNYIS
jgi:hypothetical protein